MIKYLIEKEQLPENLSDYPFIPLYDYDIDALGCQSGDKEYQSQCRR